MLTPRRRLRIGRSLWSDRPATPVTTHPLPGVLMADVVVVGAGISGALLTHLLQSRGVAVTVVDERAPVTGSTRASTALIQFEVDEPLSRLADDIGWRRARRAWQRSYRAVRDLTRLVQRAGIACDYEARRSLYLAGDLLGARALAAEHAARVRAGIPGRLLDAHEVRRRFGIDRPAAILSPGNASANPVQLTSGLLARSADAGVPMLRGVRVLGIEESRAGVVLHCDHGRAVVAQQVVLCTGYEVPGPVSKRAYDIASTWAVAGQLTSPAPAWLRKTLVWEASDPYLYLRLADAHTIVVGGRDEDGAARFTERARLKDKVPALHGDVSALLPALHWTPTHAWGGAFGTSPTGLPVIDRLPGHRRTWSVSGFGGNGITYSMIAAQVITAALQGRRDPDAVLYELSR